MASKITKRSSYYSTKVDWKVEDFSKVNSHEGLKSDVFSMANFEWRTRLYPKGWSTVYDHLSLYIFPVGLTESLNIKVSFGVTSQTDSRNTVGKEMKKSIPAEKNNMGIGWEKFMPLSELHNPAKGFIVNDTCIIQVEVSCEMIEDGALNENEPDKVVATKECKIKEEKQ